MRTILTPRIAGALLCLTLLCSCATVNSTRTGLPADVALDKDAGRGSLLLVTVRLESGERLPFVVDTGSPITLFDKSLEPKLGKRQTTATVWTWGDKQEVGAYAAPTLYLGNAALKVGGGRVASYDFKQLSSWLHRPIMGMIGMNCLSNYCIQIDFKARKMRFLAPDQVDTAKLGGVFPLFFSKESRPDDGDIRPFIKECSLVGGMGGKLLVDTGMDIDGALEPALFREPKPPVARQVVEGVKPETEYVPDCVWENETYSSLLLRETTSDVAGEGANVIGLRFLARHLVTLDFPNRTMYLLRQSGDPLPGDKMVTQETMLNALVFADGKLPGDIETRLNTALSEKSSRSWIPWHGATLNVKKNDDPTTIHYQVIRKSARSPWKLKRAWRTDQTGGTIEEYPVP